MGLHCAQPAHEVGGSGRDAEHPVGSAQHRDSEDPVIGRRDGAHDGRRTLDRRPAVLHVHPGDTMASGEASGQPTGRIEAGVADHDVRRLDQGPIGQGPDRAARASEATHRLPQGIGDHAETIIRAPLFRRRTALVAGDHGDPPAGAAQPLGVQGGGVGLDPPDVRRVEGGEVNHVHSPTLQCGGTEQS